MSVDNPSVRLGDPLPSRTRRPGRPGARRPGSRRPVWQEPPSRIGRVAQGGVLTGVVLAVLIPLWVVLVTSLSSRETINDAGGLVLVPRELDFSAYVTIFSGGLVTQALWVSTVLTVVGTAVSLTVTVLAAYGLSRPNSVAHRGLLFYFLLTFLVYPGMVPSYLVVTGLGLKDSLWALILPTAVNVFNLVVVRAFFQNIPGELLDSARIDGAGEFRIFGRIMLPLVRPALASVTLFQFVPLWHEFLYPLVLLRSEEKFTIPRGLSQFFGEYTTDWSALFAGLVLATAPLFVLFVLATKQIIAGLTAGMGR